MEGTPVLTFDTHLTAVAATSTGDYTVVFVGTNEGHLKKVSALYSSSPRSKKSKRLEKEVFFLSVSLAQPCTLSLRILRDLIFNARATRPFFTPKSDFFFLLSVSLAYACVLFFPRSLIFLVRIARFVNPFSMRSRYCYGMNMDSEIFFLQMMHLFIYFVG